MSKFTGIIERFIPNAQAALRRFPLAVLMAAALTVIILIKVNNNEAFSDEMMLRLLGGIVLAGFVTIIVTFVGEGQGRVTSIALKLVAVIAALLAGYFYRPLSFIPPMAIGAAVLFLGTAPFWRKNHDDAAVWNFTNRVWTAVVFAIAGGAIYSLGVFAIAGALDSLFSIKLYDFIQEWLLPIGLAFLAPVAWLSMLPRYDRSSAGKSKEARYISRETGALGVWVLAPLTIIYTVILIAYGIKIAIIGALPNGEIAELVTPFLIIGTLTWLILDPALVPGKRLARWYSRAWFWFMIPATVLLIIAAYIRISDYGWTLPRYLLVLATIWALGISLWFIVKGDTDRDIRIIPGFAALLLAFGSIGPWGADGFPAHSQASRLERALAANDMLVENGHTIKPVNELKLVDVQAVIRARGALRYLVNYEELKAINNFLTDSEVFPADKYNAISYKTREEIIKRFGLHAMDVPPQNVSNFDALYKNTYINSYIFSVEGYEYVTVRKNQNLNKNTPNEIEIGDFNIALKNKNITVRQQGEVVSSVDVIKWLGEFNIKENGNNISVPNLVLYSKGDVEIVMHLNSIDYRTNSTDLKYSWMNYLLLVRGIDLGED